METLLEIIHNDTWIFFEIAIVLLTTKFFGIILKKLGLPQVLGALLAGVLIGLINLLLSKANSELFLVDSESVVISTLATIGVNLIMFSAGMETNLKEIKKNGVASVIITSLGVLIPFIVGFLVSFILPDRLFNPEVGIMKQRLFFGVILTATSVGITVAVLKELNVLHGKVGASIVTAAILDDIIGIIILAIFTANTTSFSIGRAFIGLFTENPNSALVTTLNVILFFAVAIGVGFLVHFAFKKLSDKFPHTRRLSIFSLAICFLYAAIAETFFGVAAITGSFMAGMMFANMKESHYVERRIDMSAYMMFSPMFFANIGISLDYNQIGKMFTGGNVVYIVLFCIAFVIFGMAAKFVGCGAGAKICKYSWPDSCKVGIGMMVRGEVCLIVANTGKQMGLISEEYYPAIILLIIISSILTPLCLKLLYKKYPHVEMPEMATEGMELMGQATSFDSVSEEDLKNAEEQDASSVAVADVAKDTSDAATDKTATENIQADAGAQANEDKSDK